MVVRTLLDTIHESNASNGSHGIGDCYGSQTAATEESIVSDARHGIGDDGILSSSNQCIITSFNNGIASITRIIHRIPFFNIY